MKGFFANARSWSRGIALLSLFSFFSYGQFDHSSDFSGGGAGGVGSGSAGAFGGGDGGKMTPMQYVSAVRAINSQYDTQAQEQQAAMVQSNNDMAECALKEMEANNNANGNYGYGSDGKTPDNSQSPTSGQQSPLQSAAQAAVPALGSALSSGNGMMDLLGKNKEKLLLRNEQTANTYNQGVASLEQEIQAAITNTTPTAARTVSAASSLDREGNESGSGISGLGTKCYQIKNTSGTGLTRDLCLMRINDLRLEKQSAQNTIQRNQQEIRNSNSMLGGIGMSVLSGALAYWGTSQSNKQQAEANAAQNSASQEQNRNAKNAASKQSALARQICEANAQQAYDLAKQRLAEINNNRKNALSDLAMASSIPGVKQTENGNSDVPVDLGNLGGGVGPQVAMADPQGQLTDPAKDALAAANNANNNAAAPSSGGAAGGGSGGGNPPNAPNSTFGGGPGPDRAGLPISAGAKSGVVSGIGSVIPLDNSGGGGAPFDPNGGFGGEAADAGAYGRSPASGAVIGDGGMMKLLVMARRRYSQHAPELVKSLDVNKIAKNIEIEKSPDFVDKAKVKPKENP